MMMTMMRSRHLVLLTALIVAPFVHGFASLAPHRFNLLGQEQQSTTTTLYNSQQPFGIVVQAEIDPDRMGEFMTMIEHNAVHSRREPGCRRFDVWRSDDAENTFFFYEVYDTVQAVEYHKTQPHYQKWADFKASGGTISSTTYKMHGEFMT